MKFFLTDTAERKRSRMLLGGIFLLDCLGGDGLAFLVSRNTLGGVARQTRFGRRNLQVSTFSAANT